MVSRRKIVFAVIFVIVLVAVGFFVISGFNGSASFTTNLQVLKLSIPISGEASLTIKVINQGNNENFRVRLSGLDGFVSLSNYDFALKNGETKELLVYFNASGKNSGVYLEKIIISNGRYSKQIPVILTVQDNNFDLSVMQRVLSQYQNVYPGGKLGLEIEIYSLKDKATFNVGGEYYLADFNGNKIFSDEENLVIKEGLAINKIVDIPETTPKGDYVFVTSIDNNGVGYFTSYFFQIGNRESSSQFNVYYLILLIVVIFVGLVILTFYFIRSRDKFILDLEKQQHAEMKRNINIIKDYEEKIRNTKNGGIRAKKLKVIKIVRKNIISRIRKKQKSQRKELKRLKKTGKKYLMSKKLKEWQKRGYQMVELKKENFVPKSKINKEIALFERHGYKTDFLKKS